MPYIWDCRIDNKADLGEETGTVLFKLAGTPSRIAKSGELDKNSNNQDKLKGTGQHSNRTDTKIRQLRRKVYLQIYRIENGS